jgi:hypothetical protein
MTEYRLVYRGAIPPGRTVFRIVNAGKLLHSLLMFPEDPDAPPLDKQLHGSVRRPVQPIAQVFPLHPGGFGTFAVNLVEGQRYGLMSPSSGPDGVADFLKGMNLEFTPERSAGK